MERRFRRKTLHKEEMRTAKARKNAIHGLFRFEIKSLWGCICPWQRYSVNTTIRCLASKLASGRYQSQSRGKEKVPMGSRQAAWVSYHDYVVMSTKETSRIAQADHKLCQQSAWLWFKPTPPPHKVYSSAILVQSFVLWHLHCVYSKAVLMYSQYQQMVGFT